MAIAELTELPESFPAYYLTQKEIGKRKQLIQGIAFSLTEKERFYKELNQTRPVVLIVEGDETQILEELRDFIEHKIIILIGKQSQGRKESDIKGIAFGQHIVMYTTNESIMDDMDKALERYVFSFLKSALDTFKIAGRLNSTSNKIFKLHLMFV